MADDTRRMRSEEELNRDKKVVDKVVTDCGGKVIASEVQARQSERRELDFDVFQDAAAGQDYSAANLECAVDKVRGQRSASTIKADACNLEDDFYKLGKCEINPRQDPGCGQAFSTLLPKLDWGRFDSPEIRKALAECKAEMNEPQKPNAGAKPQGPDEINR